MQRFEAYASWVILVGGSSSAVCKNDGLFWKRLTDYPTYFSVTAKKGLRSRGLCDIVNPQLNKAIGAAGPEGAADNRETGERPVRSRHCMQGACRLCQKTTVTEETWEDDGM